MSRTRYCCAIVMLALLAVPSLAFGDDTARFYEGKQIRLIVGADVGGPNDAYGRLLSRYLTRHIPGNPSVIVQNMPGASSVIAANYVYGRAPQDGTVLATLINTIPLTQALGGVDTQFD